MRTLTPLLTALSLSTVLPGAWAQTKPPVSQEDHEAHHPDEQKGTTAKPAPQKPAAPSTARSNEMMTRMQAMHDRMMAAKTPEERQALMQEHAKLMQEGMGMMQGMQGQGARSPQIMQQRMDMMQSMMQMMMDGHMMDRQMMMNRGMQPPPPNK